MLIWREISMTNIRAGMIACIYIIHWVSFGFHHLIAHHHDHEQKICHAAGGEKHVHSEEYGAIACTICQIAPTSAEEAQLILPLLNLPAPISHQLDSGNAFHLTLIPLSRAQPRAPPASHT